MRSRQLGFFVAAMSLWVACKEPPAPAERAPAPAPGTATSAAPRTEASETTATEPAPDTAPETGTVLRSTDFHFAITFPPGLAIPEVQVQEVPTAAGNIQAHTWMAERGNAAFAVSASEYPAKIIQGTDLKHLLAGARDGSLASMHGTATATKDVTISGRTGMRSTFTGAIEGTSMYGQAQWVAFPPYVVAVLVATDSEAEASSPQATAFLDSLTLVGLSSGRRVASTEGGYAIEFPESYPDPTASEEAFELPNHQRSTMKLQIAMTHKGAVGIGYAQVPDGAFDVQAALDGGRDGLLKSMPRTIKLEREETLTLADNPARRVWISGVVEDNKVHGRVELIVSGHRIFIVEALAPSEAQLKADQMEAFFKSLVITPPKPSP